MSVRTVSAYLENDVGMAEDHGSAAWLFDLDFWGRCGQGHDERSALLSLRGAVIGVDIVVGERVEGDEQAFARDRVPCTAEEREATLGILGEVRPQMIALLRSCSPAELDWEDTERVLPSFARWRTLRQIAWHIADTESRYYLPRLGLGTRQRADSLFVELEASAGHVRGVVENMPRDAFVEVDHEIWTSVKVLRRLAWNERGELVVMRAMLAKARSRL